MAETIDQVGAKPSELSLRTERDLKELDIGMGVAPGTGRAMAQGIAATTSIDSMVNFQPSISALLGLDRSSLSNQFPPPPAGIMSGVSQGALFFQGAGTVAAGEMAMAAIGQLLDQLKAPTEGVETPAVKLGQQIMERDRAMGALANGLLALRAQLEALR